MNDQIFNPKHQKHDLQNKIVVGLQRISEAFKVLLWEKAKAFGLSPIQIQILIFIAHHKEEFCNVSYLAKEFNITKPTVSDAVKALDKKGLIVKDFSSSDSRRYSIRLSVEGTSIVQQTEDFSLPVKHQLAHLETPQLNDLFAALTSLISKLHHTGILTVQRNCFACRYHMKHGEQDHCNLLQQDLMPQDIRLDCAEFESAS
jgi:DNA-binding MarR family transcriptional regulator